MSEKINVQLGDVQKTLFLPLWGRANETLKKNPLLVDKTAVEIMKRVNYDLSPIANNMHEITKFAWIVRTLLMDRVIRQFLIVHPRGTIVNIGCGLDTTFDRIDNGLCTWYDLDLPDVIELRRQFISEKDRRRFVSSSLLEEGWLKLLKSTEGLLFMAAGVLYYFEEEMIRRFFLKLADTFPESELVCDVSSPMGVRAANKIVIQASGLDERSFLKWGVKSVSDIRHWDPRIKLIKKYPYFKGMKRHLEPKYRFAAMMSDFLMIQYLIHIAFSRE
jgi:O-methyltransferase involved in polyketide biosynthesis